MKKIILKINDLNAHNERFGKLEHASFHVMEGEITGLLGLNYSGKELAVQILLGETDLDWQENQIFVDDRKMQKPADIKKLVCHITAGSPVIESWTVAEYVGIRDVCWFLTKKVKDKLRAETAEQFAQMGICLDINKKMKELNELERRIVEIVRARKNGARILVIEDECEGMNSETIRQYARFLRNAIQGRMAAILLCHSNLAASILSDNYVIFRKGRVVKKWRKEFPHNNGRISDYLLGNTLTLKKKTLDSYARKVHAGEGVIYGIRNLEIYGEQEDFDFRKGEITTYVISNNAERMKVFLELCGRTVRDGVAYLFGCETLFAPKFQSFIKHKIVSVMKTGSDYEIFEKMTVGDNLLLPSLRKIPNLDYLTSGSRITQVLSDEIESESLRSKDIVKELDFNHHISIALDRWYVFHPNVIVLYEPFTSCDAYGVSIIMSYIKKFTNRGTAVIVVKSNLEYMEEVSDRIFDLG